jgi:hypothetical protein
MGWKNLKRPLLRSSGAAWKITAWDFFGNGEAIVAVLMVETETGARLLLIEWVDDTTSLSGWKSLLLESTDRTQKQLWMSQGC